MSEVFVKTSKVLDVIERTWLATGLHPLTAEGDIPTNNAHIVQRLSDRELVIVTTENRLLTFKVKG